MKLKWKLTIAAAVLLVGAAVAGGLYHRSRKDIVKVQVGQVIRQDLTSLVTASGEIKPRNYINIGANIMGRITDILVREGEEVRKGQLLAKLESVQPEAEVQAQKASVSTAEAQSAASEASQNVAEQNVRSAKASLDRTRAEFERAKISFDRSRQLFEAKLIAKQEFDQRRADLDAAEASVREAEARVDQMRAQLAQSRAQLEASQRQIAMSRANLRRATDQLQKADVVAPLNGVVTNLPVRVGETVVPGIQNSSASLVMTIADMSLITAEVKVDETDIVNVRLGQPADVTIDAIPDQTFQGEVIEIGNTAILRSTGLATSQSLVASQEAKDFKVVVALLAPPASIRPGLSCTAKIVTATRDDVVIIPIQALAARRPSELEPEKKDAVQAATRPPKDEAEMQGVFVMQDDKAFFKKVETGITGATDIEVTSGLSESAKIITGPFKAIRTMKNGTKVEIDKDRPDSAR